MLVKLVLCSDKEELGVLGMDSASECTQETGTVNLARLCKLHKYLCLFFCAKPRILVEIHFNYCKLERLNCKKKNKKKTPDNLNII